MRTYLDTCFLVRNFVTLPNSAEADAKVASIRSRPVITWLTEMEAINAFERYVFESGKGAVFRFSPEAVAVAQATFREDLASGDVYDRGPIDLTLLRRQFEALAFRHTARHGFRSYDLLHMASALILDCEQFWSFDAKAIDLAKLEGLKTD